MICANSGLCVINMYKAKCVCNVGFIGNLCQINSKDINQISSNITLSLSAINVNITNVSANGNAIDKRIVDDYTQILIDYGNTVKIIPTLYNPQQYKTIQNVMGKYYYNF